MFSDADREFLVKVASIPGDPSSLGGVNLCGACVRAREMLAVEVERVAQSVLGPAGEHANTPVSALNFSVRSSNVLSYGGIVTVGQLSRMTKAELFRIRSCGKTTVREIERTLAKLGVKLAD